MTTERSLVVCAPLRTSLVGGGSDIPSFFTSHGGAVVAMAINRYVRVRLSRGHTVAPSPMVEAALRMVDPGEPILVDVDCDVPWGTGLGSSSSLAVALIHALHLWRGEVPTKREVFEAAVELELTHLSSPIGWQDQALAALGGAQHLQFGGASVGMASTPVRVAPSVFQNLRLVRVGGTRRASQITKRITQRPNVQVLSGLKALVPPMVRALEDGEPSEIGRLLNLGWNLKRKLTQGVTNPTVDALHSALLQAGALGAKLLGAGGAGFMLAVVGDPIDFMHPVFQGAMRLELDATGSRCIKRQEP